MLRRLPALLLLLPLAACQPAPDAEPPRRASVQGVGEVAAAPEIATVNLSVQMRDRELAAAQRQAGKVVEAVLGLAHELGIPREQLQSSALQVQPEFDWNDGRQTLRGYLVQRQVRVELENLEVLGALLERAMAAGVNDIAPPRLDVKDRRALEREALRAAAKDARANAEALAGTLGVTLGEVQGITTIEQGPPQPKFEMQAMRAADAGAEQGYETGRITVQARVQAEFELD